MHKNLIIIASLIIINNISGQEGGRAYDVVIEGAIIAQEWADAVLVWSDEFDGSQVDTSKWTYQTGDGGWGNNEWQNYTAGDNVEVNNGVLKIIAKKIGTGQKRGDYTSTRMNSRQQWQYGHFAIRAKIPTLKGKGIWPAIWMLGANISSAGWPLCGEIDIMEYVSYDPGRIHQTFHSEANNHQIGTQITTGPMVLESIEEEFHIYGFVWDEDGMSFYVDDLKKIKLHFERPQDANELNWPFNQGFYFLLNMAVGGNWGGKEGVDDTIFPSSFEIDYVRVYQRP